MANYTLVANSTFQPFTYQELAMPLDRQDAYHENLMQQYEQLSDKADILEAMGKNDRDKGAYTQLKAYTDSLRNEAENLYRNGLNSESRLRLTELRRRYNQEIVPLQNAWNKREQEAEMQLKAQMSNPMLRFTRDARSTSLDDYINNPTGGFGVVNLATISAQMGAMAKNLEKQIRGGQKEGIDDFTFNYVNKYGLDANIINHWLQNKDSNPTLTNMMNQVLQTNGVTPEMLQSSPNGQNIFNEAVSAAQMGAWESIGEDKSQILENYGTRLNAQARKELDTYRKKKEIDQEFAAMNPQGGGNSINPLPLRSQQEISEKNKDIEEFIKKGFVKQDVTGQWKMTPAGWKEYRKMSANNDKRLALLAAGESSNQQALAEAKKMPDNVPSKFRKFMDEANGGKSFVDNQGKVIPGWGPNRAGNLFASAVKANEEGSYDTYHSTEYDRQLSSSYGGVFTEQLWSNARRKDGERVLDVVDYNGKDGWKAGKTLNSSDLKGYKVTNVRYSKYGNTAILQKDGEEPVRVKIPKGVNLGAEYNVRAAIANADELGMILSKGKRPMMNSAGDSFLRNAKGEIMFSNTNLTPEDRNIFRQYQRRALDEMSSYGSQMVIPSETETEKYGQFAF